MQMAQTTNTSFFNNDKIKRKTSKRQRFLYYTVFCAFVVLIFAVVCYLYLFKVNKIVVNSEELYTSEEIAAITGIRSGDVLYAFNSQSASKAILASLSFVKDVKITRSLTGVVTFDLTIDKGSMYVILGGEYYVFNSDLLVLHKNKKPDDEYLDQLMHVEMNGIRKCIVGQKIAFAAGDSALVLGEIFKALDQLDLVGVISRINMESKFAISMVYDNRMHIELGEFTGLADKLKFALEILKQFESGTIDVSDSREGSYVYSQD